MSPMWFEPTILAGERSAENAILANLVLDETAVSSKPAHKTVIYTEWHIPDVVLTL